MSTISTGQEEIDFTLAPLDWRPRVTPVDPATASEAQLAVLDAEGPWGRKHPFPLTLVHDPELYAARSRLSNASMSGAEHEDALPAADREFAALVESRVTGCRFCAFVHGNSAIKLGGDSEAVHAVIDHGIDAEISPRSRAIADLAAELAVTPPRPTEATVARLREVGLSTGQILDLVYAVSQFAWANRTMLTLGTTVKPVQNG